MTLRERLATFTAADLYVVITEEFCAARPSVEVLAAVLESGVRVVQLREKHLSDKELYRRALEFRELTAEKSALLVLNDRIDIALAAGADGVHLGQDDLPFEVARHLAPDMIIGCSSHSAQEAVAAQEAGASYVNIGPVFSTQTKSHASGPLGPEAMEAISHQLKVPWTVMGGIKASNVDLVLQRGARLVAVVTAVTAVDDVSAACATLRKKIIEGRGHVYNSAT
jgi:thiamine-phosphate pyrophosphorylase